MMNHATVGNKKKSLNFSGPCMRVRPAKLTYYSAHANLEIIVHDNCACLEPSKTCSAELRSLS